jgi:hypothetical protein
MTRDNYWDRIYSIGLTNSPDESVVTQAYGDIFIGGGFAVWNIKQYFPYGLKSRLEFDFRFLQVERWVCKQERRGRNLLN